MWQSLSDWLLPLYVPAISNLFFLFSVDRFMRVLEIPGKRRIAVALCVFVAMELLIAVAYAFNIGTAIMLNNTLIVVIQIILYTVSLCVFNIKNSGKNASVLGLFWITSLIVPVSSVIIVIMFFESGDAYYSQQTVFITITAVYIINVLASYLHETLSDAYSNRLETALLAQEKEYYFNQLELMSKSAEELKSFRHDVRNHLSTAREYIAGKRIEEALAYLDKLTECTETEAYYSRTGNMAFDSIINYKLRNAKEDGVELDIDVSVPQRLSLEVFDVVTIMGNLLDNALEAVSRAEEKRISLKVNFSKDRLIVNLENTFNGEVKYAGGEVITGKNGGTHGLGLINVRKAVEKHDGFMEISHTDNVFSADILLYAQAGRCGS